jgi:flagellar biosynthesis/type III secretory pathway protein FliH
MREIFLFAMGASIVGTVFLVSLIELIFTIQRRRTHSEYESKVKQLKEQFNTSINQVVLEDSEKLDEVEDKLSHLSKELKTQKKEIKKTYEEKIDDLTEAREAAIAEAKEHIKKVEKDAEMKAERYLQKRQKEVEEELVGLVISVTKKVLPESLTYNAQKELVMKALASVRTESDGTA